MQQVFRSNAVPVVSRRLFLRSAMMRDNDVVAGRRLQKADCCQLSWEGIPKHHLWYSSFSYRCFSSSSSDDPPGNDEPSMVRKKSGRVTSSGSSRKTTYLDDIIEQSEKDDQNEKEKEEKELSAKKSCCDHAQSHDSFTVPDWVSQSDWHKSVFNSIDSQYVAAGAAGGGGISRAGGFHEQLRALSSEDKGIVEESMLNQFRRTRSASLKLREERARKFRNDVKLTSVVENNKQWVEDKTREDPRYFDDLAKPQKPEILYIGCSDSRVQANEICGLDGGELFVHRNVANLVVPTDANLGSVLHYAVAHLDVKHIMIVGHYDCGGVRASMNNASTGSDVVDSWLMNVRDVYRFHQTELSGIKDAEEMHRRLVELNVVEQSINVFKFGVVQKKRVWRSFETGAQYVYPRVHGFVFDPQTGLLRRLDLKLRERFAHLASIYKLEDENDPQVADPDFPILVSDRWVEEQNAWSD